MREEKIIWQDLIALDFSNILNIESYKKNEYSRKENKTNRTAK